MPNFNLSEGDPEGWTETAVEYAKQFGWRIVPLHPNPKISEEDAEDPVIRLLGRSPLLKLPGEASAKPDEIRGWEGFPVASIAVLTGTGSNLAAVEIGPSAERGLDPSELKRFCASLPDTRCVRGPDRDYYLFSLRGVDEGRLNLPRLSRSNGVILHGEDSLIRVPGPISRTGVRAFRWDVQSSEGLAPFPKELLSFFGIKTDVEGVISWSKQPSGAARGGEDEKRGSQDESETSPKDDGPPGRSQRGEESGAANGALSFRSGERLRQSDGESSPTLGLPWLSRGALSILCGPTKTAGKSTFVVNLAAHLASGRPFLGREVETTPTVVLSDLPASRFRSLLAQIGIDRSARSRIHVVHPEDATKVSWKFLLSRAFDLAKREEAGIVIVDSLDQFIEVKSGVDPTTNVDVAHVLTADAPSECAVLGVKALSSSAPCQMDDTLDRLGLLGKAADAIVQMDAGSGEGHATLRRLQFASRLDAVPSYVLCEMIRGRYQAVESEDQELHISPENGASEGPSRGEESQREALPSTEGPGSSETQKRRPSRFHPDRPETPAENG